MDSEAKIYPEYRKNKDTGLREDIQNLLVCFEKNVIPLREEFDNNEIGAKSFLSKYKHLEDNTTDKIIKTFLSAVGNDEEFNKDRNCHFGEGITKKLRNDLRAELRDKIGGK